jgi:hypothetical protein
LRLDETNLISPTTISAGATSAATWYSASSVAANSAYRIVGFSDSTQATAGTYATQPSLVQGAGGIALSGLRYGSYYESAPQTITASGSLTLAHGLGRRPISIEYILRCVTAEGGYAIGDEAFVTINDRTGQGLSLYPDATNIYVKYYLAANTFTIVNATTNGTFDITNANWRLVVRAYA